MIPDPPLILGLVTGYFITGLLWAVFLRLAVRVTLKFTPSYREAYIATLLSGFALLLIKLFIETIASLEGYGVAAWILLVTLGVPAQAGVFSWRLKRPDGGRISFGEACLISIAQACVMVLIGLIAFLIVYAISIADDVASKKPSKSNTEKTINVSQPPSQIPRLSFAAGMSYDEKVRAALEQVDRYYPQARQINTAIGRAVDEEQTRLESIAPTFFDDPNFPIDLVNIVLARNSTQPTVQITRPTPQIPASKSDPSNALRNVTDSSLRANDYNVRFEAALSKVEALYPTVAKAGSPLSIAIDKEMSSLERVQPEFFDDPEFPLRLMERLKVSRPDLLATITEIPAYELQNLVLGNFSTRGFEALLNNPTDWNITEVSIKITGRVSPYTEGVFVALPRDFYIPRKTQSYVTAQLGNFLAPYQNSISLGSSDMLIVTITAARGWR